jgi:uncharacterized protein YjiK
MIKIYILLITISISSCNNKKEDPKSTNDKSNEKVISSKKNNVHEVPKEIKEISGITFLNDTVLVAIQDEDGILFYYNIKQNKIIKKQTFAGPGDYEDIAKAGNDMYVITSEGVMTQIKNFQSSNPVVNTIPTPFSKINDIEGLAYDKKNNRLLIAPKQRGLNQDKTTKHIYGFNLKTMKFETSPAYSIRLDEIESQFKGDAFEESSKKFLKALGNHNMNKIFRSSAITLNEKTGEIFVLSSLNGLILILSPQGNLNKIVQFSGVEYKQPEGIAFSPNGKLYISNEGGKSGIGNIIEIKHDN